MKERRATPLGVHRPELPQDKDLECDIEEQGLVDERDWREDQCQARDEQPQTDVDNCGVFGMHGEAAVGWHGRARQVRSHSFRTLNPFNTHFLTRSPTSLSSPSQTTTVGPYAAIKFLDKRYSETSPSPSLPPGARAGSAS